MDLANSRVCLYIDFSRCEFTFSIYTDLLGFIRSFMNLFFSFPSLRCHPAVSHSLVESVWLCTWGLLTLQIQCNDDTDHPCNVCDRITDCAFSLAIWTGLWYLCVIICWFVSLWNSWIICMSCKYSASQVLYITLCLHSVCVILAIPELLCLDDFVRLWVSTDVPHILASPSESKHE